MHIVNNLMKFLRLIFFQLPNAISKYIIKNIEGHEKP